VALLRALVEVAPDLELRVEAAHFDHRVRPDSNRDAAFAVDLAESLAVRCHVGSPDIPPDHSQAGLREARYRWLEELRRDTGADRVALGHHADDQAETVLFHLMRGTGLRGLAGIPPRRGSIVRPLLAFRRGQLLAYLEETGSTWIEDPSNSDRRWTRSRLRAEVIPALEVALPDAVERLLCVARAAGDAVALIDRVAAVLIDQAAFGGDPDGRVGLRRSTVAAADPELLAAVVRRVARASGVSLRHGGTRAAVSFMREGRSGGRVSIGGGLEVWREYGRVVIGPPGREPEGGAVRVQGSRGEGRLVLPGRTVGVRWRPTEGSRGLDGRIAVAVHPGHYPLTFRGWRPGDRIRLAGGTRKLKKLFADRRIPASERNRVPLLADGNGNVLWIDGLAVAESRCEPSGRPSFLEFELRDE